MVKNKIKKRCFVSVVAFQTANDLQLFFFYNVGSYFVSTNQYKIFFNERINQKSNRMHWRTVITSVIFNRFPNLFYPVAWKHTIPHPPTYHQASKEAHKVRHQMKETQARVILKFKKILKIPGANNLQAVFVEKQIGKNNYNKSMWSNMKVLLRCFTAKNIFFLFVGDLQVFKC